MSTHEKTLDADPSGCNRKDAEGSETHVAARLHSSLSETSQGIAALMQDMPGPGAPAGEKAAWLARKHDLLARCEEAKR